MIPFRSLVACLILTALAACGVEGDPERPEPRPAQAASLGPATGLAGVVGQS